MAKSICPHCGKPNRSAERFCATCGGRMSGTAVAIAPAGAAAMSGVLTIGGVSRSGGAGGPAIGDAQAHVTADVEQRRRSEARAASTALGTAAVLSIGRATLVPLMFASLPPAKLEHFAAFISPQVRLTHWLLAGVFTVTCVWARKRPLHAALAALVLYLAYAIPDVAANPVLIGAGHLGKFVTLGILARAAFAGVMHRMLGYEQA